MMIEQSFLKTYGRYIVLGVLTLIVGYGGFHFWKQRQNAEMEQASLLYDKMFENLRHQELGKAQTAAEQLISQHKKTPYASLAALLLARLEIEQNKSDKAIEDLQLAITLAQKGPVEHIARVRLARVLASKAQYEEALKLLELNTVAGYIPLYEEAKGDIYLMQNNLEKAREAYATAIQNVPMGVSMMPLQLKQNDLNNDLNNKEDS